jgi:hypothetical protein
MFGLVPQNSHRLICAMPEKITRSQNSDSRVLVIKQHLQGVSPSVTVEAYQLTKRFHYAITTPIPLAGKSPPDFIILLQCAFSEFFDQFTDSPVPI